MDTFQSTLPARGSDQAACVTRVIPSFISIHAPRKGERRAIRPWCAGARKFQSTLPARGSDDVRELDLLNLFWISIHAPRKGERPTAYGAVHPISTFQSTLPARGSDANDTHRIFTHRHFNPRSPQGGATNPSLGVSIKIEFQSTLPARGSDRKRAMV